MISKVLPIRFQLLFMLLGLGLLPNSADAQKRYIQLEIAAGDRAEMSTQQRWMEMLTKVGADRVRSRTAFGGVSPKIEESKLGGTISIVVTGVISNRKLILPGGRYGINDTARIRQYIQKLRDDGSEVALAEKKAFGLTSEQLVNVHKELSTPVKETTRGVNTGVAVQKMIASLTMKVEPDRSARRALAGDVPMMDELKGLSIGTSIAAAIRPLGLVLQPYREPGQATVLRLVDARNAEENWPIGWPNTKPVSVVEPGLMKKLGNIEIRGFPIKGILDRFEQRIGVPFIYDQNTMAREGIELESTKVTLVKTKTPYLIAIEKLLNQTNPKMRPELRVDENGKPFLWISTPN